MKYLKSTVFLAAVAAMPVAAQARTVAEDVADVSRVCFGMISGTVAAPADPQGEEKLFASFNLTAGIPSGLVARMGKGGQNMIARATIASRINGQHGVVLAHPGGAACRTILVNVAGAKETEAVAAALGSPEFGWLPLPAFTETRGIAERRLFIRFDERKRPYMLNLMTLSFADHPEEGVRLFTTVAAIPANVALPKLPSTPTPVPASPAR